MPEKAKNMEVVSELVCLLWVWRKEREHNCGVEHRRYRLNNVWSALLSQYRIVLQNTAQMYKCSYCAMARSIAMRVCICAHLAPRRPSYSDEYKQPLVFRLLQNRSAGISLRLLEIFELELISPWIFFIAQNMFIAFVIVFECVCVSMWVLLFCWCSSKWNRDMCYLRNEFHILRPPGPSTTVISFGSYLFAPINNFWSNRMQ